MALAASDVPITKATAVATPPQARTASSSEKLDGQGVAIRASAPEAETTAMVTETLYRERNLSVNAIAKKLHISKSTLYSYLRRRGVVIGPYEKAGRQNEH